MRPDDPLYLFLTHPLTGIIVTFVATLVVTLMVRLRPEDRTFRQDVKEKPGQVLFAVTGGTSLAAAFPRLVYETGTFDCSEGLCRVVGGGLAIVEGAGLGSFLQQFMLSVALDVPSGLLGLAVGVAIASALGVPNTAGPEAGTPARSTIQRSHDVGL